MGIYPIKNPKTWKDWNSKEQKILRDNWENKSIEEIRKMMPTERTWHSISN